MSLAQLGVQLQNRQTEDAWRRQEAQRAHSNTDRSFDFTKSQAQEKATIQRVKDADGNETLVRVLPDGTAMPIETGVNKVGGNPFNAGGKFNEGQGKAAGFTDRMLQSEGILSGVAVPEGYEGPTTPGVQNQGTSATQAGLSKIPGVGNYLVSNERQKLEQAKRDFITAQLRRESGAAISPSEFENADKQYFPVPGDKPDAIKQKEAYRRVAVEAMGREGGPSYRPKANFAPDGGVRPYAASPTRPISKAQYDALPSRTPFIAPDGSQRVKP